MAFQEAAVVPEVKTHVIRADVLPAKIRTALAPEEFTVTAPVLLFTIKNCWPRTNVEATGNVTVCVVEPVKY